MRINSEGKASTAQHPEGLGHKLTHPYITTDYSENLLEFITSVKETTDDLITELQALHGYSLDKMGDELVWPNSMPSILPAESKIPIAYYGESNVGKLKTLYRKGLSHRYGSSMQTIAGLHYNFSFSDDFWRKYHQIQKSKLSLQEFKSEEYFKLIRNFKRYSWALMYLFGCSPVVHSSFLEDKEHDLKKLGEETFYTPHGISLRMGGLGYTSSAQEDMIVCFDKVQTYIQKIEEARLQSYPEYEAIGLIKNGEYLQLNSHLLQIDNEYYSTIRPKNIAKSRESALKALYFRGVEYIEVRLLDLNPLAPLGFTKEQIQFMHLFLSWCLVKDSSLLNDAEYKENAQNFQLSVLEGRNPKLNLFKEGKEVPLKDRLAEMLHDMEELLGDVLKQEDYTKAMNAQKEKCEDITKIPSNIFLSELEKFDNNYVEFSRTKAKMFKKVFACSEDFKRLLDGQVKLSFEQEKKILAQDKLEFDDFLTKYFSDIKINYG